MAKLSAGLLLHRDVAGELQVLIVHPGGPFWAKKDEGAWSIPKGEHLPDDDPRAAAVREFTEELGSPPPDPDGPDATDLDLGTVRLKSGKEIRCFARRADFDVTGFTSNTFEQEWPPRSGRIQAFPEVDRAEWLPIPVARAKLNPAQAELLDRLLGRLEPA